MSARAVEARGLGIRTKKGSCVSVSGLIIWSQGLGHRVSLGVHFVCVVKDSGWTVVL